MLLNISFVCIYFVETLISMMFFGNLSSRKHSLVKTFCIGIAIFEFGAVISIFLINTAWLNATYSILANFLFSFLCFDIKKTRGIFYSVLLVAISTFLEIVFIFLFSSINRSYVSNYQSEIMQLILRVFLSKITYFFVTIIISKFIREDNEVKIPIGFFIYPVIATIATTSFWYICSKENIEYSNQIILAIVSMLLFLATIFMFLTYQLNAVKENNLLLLQQEQDKIKTDIAYYDILETQNNKLREYAHDAKNHLSAIKNLNSNPEVEIHISKMIESLVEYSKVSHSGNHTLDVIIDKYVTECNINEINFEYDIKNNNLSQLDPYDTVTILGNLLDNAIEAAGKSESRKILIETDFYNDLTIIIISNSCDKKPEINGMNLPATTKKNKKLHGFGLKSVKKTLKKYNGDINFEYNNEKKLFISTVMISN